MSYIVKLSLIDCFLGSICLVVAGVLWALLNFFLGTKVPRRSVGGNYVLGSGLAKAAPSQSNRMS